MNLIATRPAQLPAPTDLEAQMLENLARHAHFARGAMSPNTERARRTASTAFTAWCSARHLSALPASVDTLVTFIDDSATRQKPATVVAYVSHISAMHEAAQVTNPCRAPEVVLAKRRMFRTVSRRQKQALGITAELRQKMLDAAPDTMVGIRNRALLAMAYDTMMRRSELVALTVEDLTFNESKGTGRALLRKSKTDQEGQGMVRAMAVDTVRLVRAWLEAAKISKGPLFRRLARGGKPADHAIGAGVVRQVFKDMAAAAGLPESVVVAISAHSSRVGCAQDQAAAGIAMPKIMQSGGWTTPVMVARYTEHLEAENSGAAELARKQGRA